MIHTFLFCFISKEGNEDSVTFCAVDEEGAKQLFFNWCRSDERVLEPYKIISIEEVYNEDDAKEYGEWYGASKPEEEKIVRRGIMELPTDCIPYGEGYRFGAYVIDNEANVVEFFKNHDEIQAFVNEHPEFGRKQESGNDSEVMKKAKKLINDFCISEYKQEANFSDLKHIELAYTTISNEELFEEKGFSELSREFDIEVEANLIDFEIVTYIDGSEVCSKHYSSLEEMIEHPLSSLYFDLLIELDDNAWEEVFNRELDEASERALNEHEAECGADGRRAFPHLNDEEPRFFYFSEDEPHYYRFKTGDIERLTNEVLEFGGVVMGDTGEILVNTQTGFGVTSGSYTELFNEYIEKSKERKCHKIQILGDCVIVDNCRRASTDNAERPCLKDALVAVWLTDFMDTLQKKGWVS